MKSHDSKRIVINCLIQLKPAVFENLPPDDAIITIKDESVAAGQKAFIQAGEIKARAPELAHYEVEVLK